MGEECAQSSFSSPAVMAALSAGPVHQKAAWFPSGYEIFQPVILKQAPALPHSSMRLAL
jgi:hypothetical protein